jgi:hypothetical protein
MLIFHLYGEPPLANRLWLFMASLMSYGCNQLCKISERSVEGFLLGGCLKMACFHRIAKASLTLSVALTRLHVIKQYVSCIKKSNKFWTAGDWRKLLRPIWNKSGLRNWMVTSLPVWHAPTSRNRLSAIFGHKKSAYNIETGQDRR